MNETEKKEFLEFMKTLDGREKAQEHELQTLFNWNNKIYPDLKEFSTYCPDCVSRVYKRLKTYRDTI